MSAGSAMPNGPRQGAGLVGHADAERTLLQSHLSGRLHHAWLLAGPAGIGKATLAYRFARFVLRHPTPAAGLFGGPDSLYVPPDDPVFRRVASGGHADLLAVERSPDDRGRMRTEIVVEDARKISGFLHKTAGEGGWRVVLVDSADEMNRHSANSLLKILEEPPPRAVLLLVAHNPGRLPPTIRSRCRILALRPLGIDDTMRVIAEQMPDLDRDEAQLLARLSEGRPGYALALARRGGGDLFRALVEIAGRMPGLDVGALHALGDRFAGRPNQEAFVTFMSLLSWWIARIARLGRIRPQAAAGQALDLVPGEAAVVMQLAESAPLDRWCELWEKTTRLADRADALNLDPKQVVLNALLAMQTAVRGAVGESR